MGVNAMALAQAKAREKENKEREAAAAARIVAESVTPPAVSVPVAVNMEPPIQRTGAGLRDALFDEIDQLRAGKGNASKAMAIAKLTAQILNVVSVELKAHKTAHDLGMETSNVETIRLGR
jgi:hypothetical protein